MAVCTTIVVLSVRVELSQAWPIVLISVAYLLGVQGITVAFHIPLNNHIKNLKTEDLNDQTLANERLKFETKWNFFNNMRTGIAISVSLLLLVLLSLR